RLVHRRGSLAMHVLHRASTAGLVVLAGALLLSAGCSSRTKAVVKGQVVFFDKKLSAGTVSFQGQGGAAGSGNIDFNRNYTVADAPVGPCTVTVRVPQVPPMVPPGSKVGQPPKGMPPMRPPGGEADDSGSPLVDPNKIVKIPNKYAKPETSGLTFTVEPGENKY